MSTIDTSTNEIVFADEQPEATGSSSNRWKVIIVDDDQDIHDVTTMVLRGFQFAGRELEIIQCFSGEEAKAAIIQHPDTALILLDVVMESDHAGLDVARYVREQANNNKVRIVLRTGQPGQAPEHKVIEEYDINDYKEKTELTAHKLYTLMYTTLRSYRDITAIEAAKQGLKQVVDASANISSLMSMNQFAGGVLDQLTALLHADPGALYMGSTHGGLTTRCDRKPYEIIAGTGQFENRVGSNATAVLSNDVVGQLQEVRQRKTHGYKDNAFFGYFENRLGGENLVYMAGVEDVSALDKDLIELFSRNVSIAFENIHLHEDLEATQREIVYLLGEAVETRSRETGNHVKRVAEISQLLALDYGLSEDWANVVKFASPLHDLGKIGIPDAILNKPGKHTDEEREVMKTHAKIGQDMLKGSNRRVLRAASTIAGEHHERWDGAGYPDGKKGQDIDILGRITAVADVFDALGSERCYKKAWPMEKVLDLMIKERGQQFDPTLVDILLKNIDKIENIQARYSDKLAA